ncbi:hypothetical protein K438DRAFT_1790249 [Mycena galopus ATCC 62051]|nr:hypothetical protein K438DRAFT_1790249 [Mycena galopus ATCC 62051]
MDGEVQASTRLYLLHDRLEPLKDEAPQKITMILRHYLELVTNPNHRKAITRLLVSQHPLAIDRMRNKSRYHRVEVPRDLRVCWFGCREKLVDCRRGFVNAVQGFDPSVLTVAPWNVTRVLRGLIFRRDTVCQVAKYAYKVFAIFNGEVMVWPRGY